VNANILQGEIEIRLNKGKKNFNLKKVDGKWLGTVILWCCAILANFYFLLIKILLKNYG